jgi:hypothetical protein
MSWRDATDDDCVFCQHLYRDDNVVLGVESGSLARRLVARARHRQVHHLR